jgi:hypothetical protein
MAKPEVEHTRSRHVAIACQASCGSTPCDEIRTRYAALTAEISFSTESFASPNSIVVLGSR